MKTFIIKFYLLLALFLPFSSPAQAAEDKDQKIIHIPSSEIVTTNIYALADEITIDGIINGDLIALSKKITINGQIDGDLIAISPEIIINGPIGGNVRVIGDNLSVNSLVSRNITATALKIALTEKSQTSWDVYLAGKEILVNGKIDGSLKALAEQINLSGEINGDVDVKIPTKKEINGLRLDTTLIGGNLIYESPKIAEISDYSSIKGEVYSNLKPVKEGLRLNEASWIKIIYKIVTAFIFGLLIIILGRKHLVGIFDKITSNPKKIFIPGILLFFGAPLLSIILLITVIGIPLSLIVIISWTISIYLAKVLMMIFFGRLIIKFFLKEKPFNLIWALVLGVAIFYLLFSFPIIVGLISLIASLAGLGAMYLYVNNKPRGL